ncbi:hypothetical protein DB346_14970 [Verrucomicrobia bacterium LW23]|nr:hypothetical protein DB346_14970 [Verrucomicrobia bacterium LW23]
MTSLRTPPARCPGLPRAGTSLLAAAALAATLLAPAATRAETAQETAARARVEQGRIDRFRETRWDAFLAALKSGKPEALKPFVQMPLEAGDKKLGTAREVMTYLSSPRILRGINRAKVQPMENGFQVEWSGEGSNRQKRYALTWNELEAGDGRLVVTRCSSWTQ